jgi:DNA modification methylase
MAEARSILDGRCIIHVGDCVAIMAAMEPNSVECVVTSPPYWGLRDYGVDGQHGLEPTLAEHLEIMVAVFEGVKRILKPTGTLWVNYGDCYATTPNGRSAADTKAAGNDDRTFRDKPFSTIQGALKAKDLCMVPNRFAIALQEAGWWVRSEIVWAKPNPMPESIRDRPASSHEKIFLLSKSARYFYDPQAVRQNRAQDEDANTFRGGSYVGGEPGPRAVTGNKIIGKQDMTAASAAAAGASSGRRMAGFNERWDAKEKSRGHAKVHEGFRDKWDLMTKDEQQASGRNLRNYEPAPVDVWPIATQPFSEAHFATFPPELAERCILAGCPKGGVVFDPYGGAGTTGLVALRHGRTAILSELNPAYADIAARRIKAEWRAPDKATGTDHGPLFQVSA